MKRQYFGWLRDAMNKKLSGGNSTTVGNSTVEKKPSSVNLSAPTLPLMLLPKQPLEARLRKVGDAWQIKIEKGFVEELKLPGTNATIYHAVSGVETWMGIADGQTVIVKCLTDIKGTITDTPTVSVVSDAGLTGEHYRPEVFDFGGNTGSHVRRLYKFVLDGTKPTLLRYIGEEKIEHYAQRVTMVNIEAPGDNYDVGKDYEPDNDRVRLRKLNQLSGEGVTLIKEQDDSVIKFRRVKGKYEGQIKVREEGDAILVEGNGKAGTLTHMDCDGETSAVILEWDDGLVTSESATFTAGCSTSGSGREIP